MDNPLIEIFNYCMAKKIFTVVIELENTFIPKS